VNQGAFSATTSLIQAGLYRSGADHYLDTCGTSVNKYTYYTEYKVTGSVNGYTCALYGVASPLQEDFFTVSNDQQTGSGNWQWFIGGPEYAIAYGIFNIGSTTAIPMYGEEISSPTNDTCQTSGTAGFYGGSTAGFSDWNVFFADNSGDLKPIVSPGNTDWASPNPSLWSDPSLTPWPETISHTPASGC
jgi:hypothetical protein